MSRDHSHATYGRRNQNTKEIKKIVLFVEGRNTEPSYFELLKKSNCKIMPVTIKGHGIGSCVEFVEEAKKKYECMPKTQREKYVQRWLVYDCDGHGDFEESIRIARNYGFSVAFSNMCIEYWFALHFMNHDGKPIPLKGDSHSLAQIGLINRAVALYNKRAQVMVKPYNASSKQVDEDFFDLMMAINPDTHRHRILDAYERAMSIHNAKRKNGAEFRESVTTMYELIRELGVITKNEDGTLVLNK